MYDDDLEEFATELGLGAPLGLASSSSDQNLDIYGVMPSSPSPLQSRKLYQREHRPPNNHTARKPQNPHGVLGLPSQYPTNFQGYQRPLRSADPFDDMVNQEDEYALRDAVYGSSSDNRLNRLPAPVPAAPSQLDNAIKHRARGGNLRNAGISLRPVSDLPDVYRTLFKFGVFNAVQSRCYDTAIDTGENMVISAPTGSGKTVLFELAMIRLLKSGASHAKCVYMAPTKALCMERFNDWTQKFQHIGVKCCQLTGDTVESGRNAWYEARDATVIVTTPEKWDSLTRNWHDHQEILSTIQLFLVDEVHILNESRGSTLEVCISRMKTRGCSVRFVLLSATAPNIEDIAAWIGTSEQNGSESSSRVFKFGEEFRPCQITRHVYAYPRKQQNEFQFNRSLDFKVFDLLAKHCGGKPVLVFCSTRKGVITAADTMMKQYTQLLDQKKPLPWLSPKPNGRSFQEKQLTTLAGCGIGVHHAGLNLEDRRLTEELFLSGHLQVVVATSTLAVGVNLPARTTIIKGTQMWGSAGWTEYSDLDVMQMIGRAGRPQFDKDGVAVIMCSSDMEHRYRTLTSGQTVIESNLHLNLTEHINSEIGLGTIRSLESAHDWLRNSFLFQRVKKNPGHYQKGMTRNDETGVVSLTDNWQRRLDSLVDDTIKQLADLDLVKKGDKKEFKATEYGEIMSRYYIRYSTMKCILQLPEKVSMKEILETVSQAEEFSDIRLRGGDKVVYNKMREHNDIRFRLGKVEKTADKVMLLIQAVLGGISLNSTEFKSAESQPALEALGVFKHACRIVRAVVDVAIVRRSGSQIKFALELVRSLVAKAWDDRPIVLRQISHIGEKSIKVLTASGISSLALLRSQDPLRLELLLNRKSPFGREILAELKALPSYHLSVAEDAILPSSGCDPVAVTLKVMAGLATPIVPPKGAKKLRTNYLGFACILTITSELDFIDFRRIPVKALQDSRSFDVTAELTKPSQTISVIISSENFAGLTVIARYKPSLPANAYPTMDTRPQDSLVAELEALENCDGLWDSEGEVGLGDQIPMVKERERSPPTQQDACDNPNRGHHVRLPNGNYKCNHTCKDRAKCRHICCREGTAKPLGLSKKATSQTTVKPRVINRKPSKDTTMQDLEQLTNTTKFGRTAKGRLKLHHPKIPREVSQPNFTKLGSEDEENDNDERLPDLRDLVKRKKPTETRRDASTDEFYDDSELNAALECASPSSLFIQKEPSTVQSTALDDFDSQNERIGALAPLTDEETGEANTQKRRFWSNISNTPPAANKAKRPKMNATLASSTDISAGNRKLLANKSAIPSTFFSEQQVQLQRSSLRPSIKSDKSLFLPSSDDSVFSVDTSRGIEVFDPEEEMLSGLSPNWTPHNHTSLRKFSRSPSAADAAEITTSTGNTGTKTDELDFIFDEDTFDIDNAGDELDASGTMAMDSTHHNTERWAEIASTSTLNPSRSIVSSYPRTDQEAPSFKRPSPNLSNDPKPVAGATAIPSPSLITSQFASQLDEFMDWVYNSGDVEIIE